MHLSFKLPLLKFEMVMLKNPNQALQIQKSLLAEAKAKKGNLLIIVDQAEATHQVNEGKLYSL